MYVFVCVCELKLRIFNVSVILVCALEHHCEVCVHILKGWHCDWREVSKQYGGTGSKRH